MGEGILYNSFFFFFMRIGSVKTYFFSLGNPTWLSHMESYRMSTSSVEDPLGELVTSRESSELKSVNGLKTS